MDIDSKHIDELFRKKFENFEVNPPESVWDKIKSGLPSGSSGTLFSNPVTLASMAAIILIALMVGLNFMKQPDIPMVFTLEGPQVTAQKDKLIPPPQTPQATQSTQKITTEVIATVTPTPTPSPGPQTSFGKQFTDPAPEKKTIKYKAFNIKSIGLNDGINNGLSANQTIGENNLDDLNKNIGYNGDYVRKSPAQWTLGVYLTPEVVFYPQDNTPNQSAYHVDLSAAMNFSDYFIESGIGFNFSTDDGAYKYDYEKYIGTYDDVYLVTFDSTQNGIIPTYHTQPVDVYDSIREVYEPTKNRYTYLEIPVLFGLRKQVNRLSWFVKGGPAFGLLIHEKKGNPGQTDKDRFTMIENEQPKRLNAYWELMLSAGINYRISKHFSLAFEPVFRYYMQSGYDRAYIKSRHPYAVGVRAGVLYNFNN